MIFTDTDARRLLALVYAGIHHVRVLEVSMWRKNGLGWEMKFDMEEKRKQIFIISIFANENLKLNKPYITAPQYCQAYIIEVK